MRPDFTLTAMLNGEEYDHPTTTYKPFIEFRKCTDDPEKVLVVLVSNDHSFVASGKFDIIVMHDMLDKFHTRGGW
jgi:hypothetical protein